LRQEDEPVSLLEAVAAVLLVVGSLVVLRAVYLADTLEPEPAEPSRPAVEPVAQADYPKAA
jgi:hypothetical protein